MENNSLSARGLGNIVNRSLVYRSGYSGLQTRDFDPVIMANQSQCGHDILDIDYIVIAHQKQAPKGEYILGIREEVRRHFMVKDIGGEEVEVVSRNPETHTIWVGENVKLMTPDEAKMIIYGNKNALEWATVGEDSPERVVRANNGFFYPASRRDSVINTEVRTR